MTQLHTFYHLFDYLEMVLFKSFSDLSRIQ